MNNIVHDYSSLIKEKYNIISTLPNLPFIYWIPKFHKYPIDFRFITSDRYIVISTISKKIGNGFHSMLLLEKTQCNFNHKYDGIKNDYMTESTKEVIDFMVASNLLNDGYKYINMFDFKTLYTKIPHDKLKENL